MPPDIVAKLNGAMDAYLRSPETRKRFADAGINAVGGPPDVLTKKIEYERTKWSDIIAAAKIGDHK